MITSWTKPQNLKNAHKLIKTFTQTIKWINKNYKICDRNQFYDDFNKL